MAKCKVVIKNVGRCTAGISKGDFGYIHEYNLDDVIPTVLVESGGKLFKLHASDVRVLRKRRKKIFKH